MTTSPPTRACTTCGATLPARAPGAPGRPLLYCSQPCRRTAERRNRKLRGDRTLHLPAATVAELDRLAAALGSTRATVVDTALGHVAAALEPKPGPT